MRLIQLMPAILAGLMALGEVYASRVRREGARTADRGSLFVMYLLIAAGYGAAFGLWRGGHSPGPRLGDWSAFAGAAVALCGIGLRAWSVATLGQYFTYVVKVSPDQKVVETGPYRLIRHPSYTGAMLIALGIGLSMRWAWAPLIIGVPNLAAYLIRIVIEERALAEGIGEPYRAYMRRTKRLIPYLW